MNATQEYFDGELRELQEEAREAINPKDLIARDECRLQLGLIPPAAKEATARVHMLGARKYGPYNWRDIPVCLSAYADAIERHLEAIRRGEWIDPESGQPHAAHIGAGANIIIDARHVGTLTDDLRGKDR